MAGPLTSAAFLPHTNVKDQKAVFFTYRLADKSEAVYSQVVEQIKLSLQKTLVSFFSFAGRWIPVRKGSRRRKLLCTDAGVPFIEAYVDKDLDTVVDASTKFQPVPELQGHGLLGMDATQFKAEMAPDGLPPMFIQLTRFKCGGLVLAVTCNHMSTDAKGFFNFMTAWSDLSRTNETEMKVDYNREKIEIPSITELFPDRDITSSTGVGSDQPAPKLGLWATKAYEVSASTIQSLKKEAKENKVGTAGYVSTGDCIVAHLWRSLAGIPSSLLGQREPTVTRTVEGRTRFYDPPIPNLCGNVVTSLLAPSIPKNELLDMPVVSIASRLRDTLQATRREDWFSMERYGKMLKIFDKTKFAPMMITSWTNFCVYGIDFGFGKPFFVSGGNTECSLGTFSVAQVLPPIPNSPSSAAMV
ncbi:unnamed protein product [Calypogeia fissa]